MSFTLEFQPWDSTLLRYGLGITDKEFSIIHETTINGIKERTLYKSCRVLKSKARCPCGKRWWTNKGFFDRKRIDSMRQHLASCHTKGKIEMTQNWEAKERIKNA